MFTLIETIHKDNGAWWNEHTECETLDVALALAATCDDTSTVQVVDENWTPVTEILHPWEVVEGKA